MSSKTTAAIAAITTSEIIPHGVRTSLARCPAVPPGRRPFRAGGVVPAPDAAPPATPDGSDVPGSAAPGCEPVVPGLDPAVPCGDPAWPDCAPLGVPVSVAPVVPG